MGFPAPLGGPSWDQVPDAYGVADWLEFPCLDTPRPCSDFQNLLKSIHSQVLVYLRDHPNPATRIMKAVLLNPNVLGAEGDISVSKAISKQAQTCVQFSGST